ncbi:MAG: prohibitin family protein [Chthonomonas sp.]|nr:prohibitin family protein [Chthonomonas sp.]
MVTIGIFFLVIGISIYRAAKREEHPAQRAGKLGAGGFFTLFGLILTLTSCIKVVQSGHVGVVRIFGSVQPVALAEGLHVVNPFATVESVSIRTEEYTMSGVRGEGAVSGDDAIRTLSRDGLPLPVDVTVNYRVMPGSVPWLFRNVGIAEDYIAKIVRPSARAAVRDAVSQFTAQEAYSSKRDALADLVSQRLSHYIESTLSRSEGYKGSAFIVQQVLIRNIELPDRLKASIEAKLTAEQEALRMQYILDKEKQEAERKRIEARGIADFQAIVSQGLTDKLLMWKGIEATQDLAKSDNSKVVIVGGGKGGLPVILNADSLSTGK